MNFGLLGEPAKYEDHLYYDKSMDKWYRCQPGMTYPEGAMFCVYGRPEQSGGVQPIAEGEPDYPGYPPRRDGKIRGN